jgi:hypothetical protein
MPMWVRWECSQATPPDADKCLNQPVTDRNGPKGTPSGRC